MILGLKGQVTRSISAFPLVCPENYSKTNDRKLSKLGTGLILGYPRSDMVWGFKITGSIRVRVKETAIELYEFLLVFSLV